MESFFFPQILIPVTCSQTCLDLDLEVADMDPVDLILVSILEACIFNFNVK